MGAPIPPLVSDPMWIHSFRDYLRVKCILEAPSLLKDVFFDIWWKFNFGTEVEVKWPRGWYKIDEDTYGESADPNDHYRPWLEENVGKQSWDWNWKIGDIANDKLLIKFRKSKIEYADLVVLKWG